MARATPGNRECTLTCWAALRKQRCLTGTIPVLTATAEGFIPPLLIPTTPANQITLIRRFDAVNGTVPSDPNDLSCPSGTCQKSDLTYDGHGRIWKEHLPQQQADPNNGASTDHSTWTYYSDDTIEKTTDARGASATYGYNGRHLVTSVTYNAPSGFGIIVPASIGYGYDAAKNRTSMTDGLGNVAYEYDQLSRLTAETRQFSDSIPQAPLSNNRFKISYEYNLVGQLKMITTPYGEQLNYARDSIGRITGVTGLIGNWGSGPQSYLSNIAYRAWGAVKSELYPNSDFGNGCYAGGMTVTQTYDIRLRPASYELSQNGGQQYCTPGRIFKKQYQYQDNGLMKYVQDVSSGNLDRSQEYDHASRLTHVKTGPEAQGGSGLVFYRQNYSYDAFENTLSRQMTTPQSDETQTYTYLNQRATSVVNNQPTAWQYDADGRVTDDTHTKYSYDASGQVIGSQVTNEYVMNRTIDGDGLVGKQAVGETSAGTPLYLVRSTLLEGQIITSAYPNTADGIPTTFGYAFGQILVKCSKLYYSGQNWELSYIQFWDPSGTTHYDSDGSPYNSNRRMELDPTRAIVMDSYNPNPPPPTGGYFDSWTLGNEGFRGSPFGGSSCFMDGFEANCGRVLFGLEVGTVDECPDLSCGPSVVTIRRKDGLLDRVLVPLSHDFNSGELGYFPEQWGFLDPPQHINHGKVTEEQIQKANEAVDKNYDKCKQKYFGSSEFVGTRSIPGRDAAAMSLAVGMNNADIATRVAGIFSQESDFSLNPKAWGNEAGPAQLSGWVLKNQYWAYVGDPYGTRLVKNSKGELAIDNRGQWDGNSWDNMAMMRNIVLSYKSDKDAAYNWGPGQRPPGSAGDRQVRNKYASEVTARTPTYRKFFNCLLTGQ